jgi:hypothetical protein
VEAAGFVDVDVGVLMIMNEQSLTLAFEWRHLILLENLLIVKLLGNGGAWYF